MSIGFLKIYKNIFFGGTEAAVLEPVQILWHITFRLYMTVWRPE
jgi:hypothetical protein